VSPFKRHDVTVSFGLLTHQCEMPSSLLTTQRPCWGHKVGPRNTFFVTRRPPGANNRAFSTFDVGRLSRSGARDVRRDVEPPHSAQSRLSPVTRLTS
jgi:hypothetical protein